MEKFLFWLCWIAYFSTYIGRLNYSASLTGIILSEGFSKGQAGMIGTAFFFAYGAGQFVSGFLGDRLAPKKMVFTGLMVSGLCNLAMAGAKSSGLMTAVWCVNGLFQAFIWSPMIRLMYEYYKTETRMKACVSLNSSVPIGTMAAYGLTALVIWLSGWRTMFVLAGAALIGTSLFWITGMKRVERYAAESGKMEEMPSGETGGSAKAAVNWKSLLIQSGFLFLMMALFVQGALKDGVTTWVPTYISETYGLSAILAITSTMVIPVFNLLGVYLASFANIHWFRNEVRTAGAFFVVSAAAILVLRLSSGRSMAVSFLMLALATTAMMAVNTMLIAVLPSYFGVIGRASSVSGLLNSSVYAGGAVSTYGIGALSVALGWNATIVIWFLMAAVSAVICFLTVRKWIAYRKEVLQIWKE
ncbi:MFS transporter [Hungatella sp.]|jgi:OPA family glycerol-3-phosphate transporter-like MFS transporter|uniref:MFS transporter n=1 Tax=Hungatella sp. TaxID=2613924 RepID=UPI002A836EF7|nr:MFS transporter [Hungatella sp.]